MIFHLLDNSVRKLYSSTMGVRKVFLIISNCLGLNFSEKFAPLAVVVFYQIISLGYGFYSSFYKKSVEFGKLTKDIYFIVDIIQGELLFTIQVAITIRAFTMRAFQKELDTKIENLWSHKRCSRSGEKKFIGNFFLIILIRIIKIKVATGTSIIFMLKQMFSELSISSSDFLFQLNIGKLTANLKAIRSKLLAGRRFGYCEDEREELLKNFWIKRDIQRRYSFELFATVAFNFAQLIIALYFICMRIKFNRLKTFQRQ